LPHQAGTNLRRIAHPQLVTQLAQQIHQPVAVAGGFHADQRGRRYLPVEPFRVARGLYQLLLPGLSRLRIQPTHLLPAGMKITSYNHHVRRLLSFREALVLKPRLPDSIEPSLLSNQPFAVFEGWELGISGAKLLQKDRSIRVQGNEIIYLTLGPWTKPVQILVKPPAQASIPSEQVEQNLLLSHSLPNNCTSPDAVMF